MWDSNIISAILIQRASQCYYSRKYIFNMVGPSESWSPDIWRRSWHVLPIDIQWTSLHLPPFTNWLLNILPLWFTWSRIKASPVGPLWALATLDRIQIFTMTAANAKQKFSWVKGIICKTGSSFPWSGGEIWCLVASVVFLPEGLKWVTKLKLRENNKEKRENLMKKETKNEWHKFSSLPCPLSVIYLAGLCQYTQFNLRHRMEAGLI